MPALSKTKKIFLSVLGFLLGFLLVVILYFYAGSVPHPKKMQWGVTFSQPYAEQLGISWKDVYEAILNDLRVDHLRLIAYWDRVEPTDGQFDFTDLDFQVQEAQQHNAQILLAIGRKLPRWPECHIPGWAQTLPLADQEAKALGYLRAVVDHYKNSPNITMWQVENEFFFDFGSCPKPDPAFFDQELAAVRSLDRRPIVLTDSGELGWWWPVLKRGDIFGTTMYRTVYNHVIGYTAYPLRAIYYFRRFLLSLPFARARQMIDVELQAEPWAQSTLTQDALELQYQSLSPRQFQKNLDYARVSGVSPAYLWGAEWWYYMDKVRQVPDFWNLAKTLWVAEPPSASN